MPQSSSQATDSPAADPPRSAAILGRSPSWSRPPLVGRTGAGRPGPWFATSPSRHTLPNHDPCKPWCLLQWPALQEGSLPKLRSGCKRALQWLIEETILRWSVDLLHWGLHDDMPGHKAPNFSKSYPIRTWLFPSAGAVALDCPNGTLPVVRTWQQFHRHVWWHKRLRWPSHRRTAEWWATNDDLELLGRQTHSWRSCSFAHGCSMELVGSPCQRSSDLLHDHLVANWPRQNHWEPWSGESVVAFREFSRLICVVLFAQLPFSSNLK